MATPYIGEIRMFAGSFAPAGWAFCDGSLLAIAENDALFSLIGTTYGGDGQSTFGLPDLRGRAMIGVGQGPGLAPYVLGEAGGAEQVTLTVQQLPAHGYPVTAEARTRSRPVPGVSLATGGAYVPAADATMTTAPVGGSQPHANMPPYLTVSFIIALFGVFPSPA